MKSKFRSERVRERFFVGCLRIEKAKRKRESETVFFFSQRLKVDAFRWNLLRSERQKKREKSFEKREKEWAMFGSELERERDGKEFFFPSFFLLEVR